MSGAESRIPRALPLPHPALAGHFPGQPVLPGVCLLAEVLEAMQEVPSLAALLGARPRVENVKFLAPVRPGGGDAIELTIVLTPRTAGADFEVLHAGAVAARGQLRAAPAP